MSKAQLDFTQDVNVQSIWTQTDRQTEKETDTHTYGPSDEVVRRKVVPDDALNIIVKLPLGDRLQKTKNGALVTRE